MIPLPKPRSFWDYALFALVLTALLMFVFRLEASDGVGWPDAALALAASVLCVLIIILARRGEKAAWIVRPTWQANLLLVLGAFSLMYGAIYADAHILHRRDINATRFHDIVIGIVLLTAVLMSLRRKNTAGRQLP